MNISYLLSILDLYLFKENNRVLIIQVDNQTNQVKVNFSYSTDYFNKTFVKIDKDEFFNNLEQIKRKIKGNLVLKEEQFMNNNYLLDFTDHKLNFINFSLEELKIIRKTFLNKDEFDFITTNIENYDQILNQQTTKPKLAFSMGFTSYLTLFISSVFFLDIFMIALLIFSYTK